MTSSWDDITKTNELIRHGAQLVYDSRKTTNKALETFSMDDRMEAIRLNAKVEEFSFLLRVTQGTQTENIIRSRIWERVDELEARSPTNVRRR